MGRDSPSNKDERGRNVTSSSLEVGSSVPRASSVRSTMSGEPLVLHGWTRRAGKVAQLVWFKAKEVSAELEA